MIVLSLDPSTAKTGAVVTQFSREGIEVLGAVCCTAPRDSDLHGDADMKRIQRITSIRQTLASWLLTQPVLDGVSYEFHTGRGGAPSEAITEATGAYLTISGIPGRRLWRIYVPTAKAAWGGGKLATAQAKPAVVAWARREFARDWERRGLKPLSDDDDAIADALAVAVATWGKWREEELAKMQPRLTGKRGGKL